MIERRVSSAFIVKSSSIAISSVITLFLLTLVLALTYSPGAEAATLEIKFTGTVLQYHFTGETAWWRVLIDQQSLDPPPCSNPIDVLIGGGIPQSGYVDPNIQVGDRVEVYGAEQWGAEWCYIGLPLAHHYIKKIGGGGPSTVTFRGEIVVVRTMAPFSCVIRVDEVLSGSVTCNYVELGISFGTQGHADWPLNEGDKVEVHGEFDPNHCWVSIDDSPSYYIRLLSHEETYTVQVSVYDAVTKAPLPGASVYVNGSYVGSTGTDGNLSLSMPKGQYTFRVTKTGYKPEALSYFIDKSLGFHVELEPEELPQEKPDLTITDIKWVPAQPTEEDTITINVTVKNQGSKEAGSFYTALYADGIYLEKKYSNRLTAGATATIAFTGGASKWAWMKQCDRNHALKAIADYDRQVDESNENNNELSKTIRVECGGTAPFIRDWLIIGPFTFHAAEERSAFDKDYIGETTVQPSSGMESGGKKWKEHHDSDDYIDFDTLFSPNDYAIAYAHVYVNSPKTQQVQLRLGSDDAIKAWLNGSLVHSNYTNRGAAKDQDIKTVTLQHGWNRLLIKVLERIGGWGFYARFTDQSGDEVPGLEYRLNPPVTNKPDLVVTEITWSPQQPTSTDTIGFVITVKNQGQGDAAAFTIAMYVDGSEFETRQTPMGLLPGGTVEIGCSGDAFKWSWISQCDRSHTIRVVADSARAVPESNESNNERQETIHVTCVEEPPGSFTGLSFSAACTPDGKIRCDLRYDNQLGEKSQILFIFRKQATGEVVAHEVVEVDQGTGTTKVYFDCPPNESGVYHVSWKAYKKCDTTSPLPYNCPLWSCADILADSTLRGAVLEYDVNSNGEIDDSEKWEATHDYLNPPYDDITKNEACAVVNFNQCGCEPAAWSNAAEEQEVVCPCGGADKLPDLVVEDIYWRPANPTEEDSLGLYIKLWNKGNKDAGSFYPKSCTKPCLSRSFAFCKRCANIIGPLKVF